jgi:lipopolysaccharide/colanic/teichoic acid biosynthesis glycosyltransferase
MPKYPAQHISRRCLDVAGSVLGLVVLSPLFVLIALGIKLESKGPVFYRASRLGRFGKPFSMLKFRSMKINADRTGAPITPNGDPRVTRLGVYLRKYKFDELPQLFNVLTGEMSLVGPRPEAAFYYRYYTEAEKQQILSVRPGMTDYGSLLFHDEGKILAGAADPVKTYLEQIREMKVKAQLEYIRDQSLVTDIMVICRTVSRLFITRVLNNV